jgi:hypothetical protein
MNKRIGIAIASVAVLGLAAFAVTVLIGGSSPSQAATVPTFTDPTVGFRDQASGAYLRIDLTTSDATAGEFYFSAPGIGLALPGAKAQLEVHSTHDEQFRYDGAGTLYATAVVNSDIVQPVATGPSTAATVRVVGHTDGASQTATVEVWINGQHFNLKAAPAPHTADPTVAAVVTALKATDLGALYDLADISLRNGLTREQFVTQLGATGGGGSVSGVNVTGVTSYVTTSAGADFALTPITFDYTKAGAQGHVIAHLRLIFTGGQWRYLTMQPDSTPANSDDNTPDPNLP